MLFPIELFRCKHQFCQQAYIQLYAAFHVCEMSFISYSVWRYYCSPPLILFGSMCVREGVCQTINPDNDMSLYAGFPVGTADFTSSCFIIYIYCTENISKHLLVFIHFIIFQFDAKTSCWYS